MTKGERVGRALAGLLRWSLCDGIMRQVED